MSSNPLEDVNIGRRKTTSRNNHPPGKISSRNNHPPGKISSPPQLKEQQRFFECFRGEGFPDMSRSVSLSCPGGGCLQIRWRMLILGEEKPVPGITTIQEKSVPPPTT
ncbi:hypothetical protein CDAR_212001 [Caerostris darwini]|uniref:Uncharacterized protein n=1 Tax=Caerostris darwini TaxID=1538125 RepID=A0AAV4TYQ6_9ARAC|nr:hypothetical protein CDAR_212001 [Caerostris darwini]